MKKKAKKINKFQILFKKNKRFRVVVAIAAVLFAIVFLSAFSALLTRFESAHRITAAVSVEPEKLDPTFCDNTETETILVNCFEGLMRINENGEAVKACADDFTVSKNGLVYTFTISPKARWSNGDAVTADDFVYAWQRTANPYNSSMYANLFENIVGYDKILEDFEKEKKSERDEEGNYITINMSDLWVRSADSRTLVVKLKEKDPNFLKKCAGVGFFPLCERAVKPYTRIWSTDKEKFVSNGAFVLSSWTDGSYLDLSRNEYFRDKENVSIKSIKFKFIPDGKEAVDEFNKDNVLYSSSLDDENINKIIKKKEYKSYDRLGSYFLYFNLSKEPFDDVRVRKALTLAIDREKLIKETAPGKGSPASGVISNAFSSFRDNNEEYFDVTDNEANIEKAKTLLKKAGYENGEKFPKFEYLFNDNTVSRKTAELICEMWKENLGIECDLKSVSWSKLDEMRNKGNFYIAKGGILSPYNDVTYILSEFTSSNNFCFWQNKEYDGLARQMINSQSNIMSLASSAEKILADNQVVCPLYYYEDGYLISDRVKDYYVSDSGVAYFMYADVF